MRKKRRRREGKIRKKRWREGKEGRWKVEGTRAGRNQCSNVRQRWTSKRHYFMVFESKSVHLSVTTPCSSPGSSIHRILQARIREWVAFPFSKESLYVTTKRAIHQENTLALNLYAPSPIVWFQIGKGVCQGGILSPCLFNLYAEYIMRNAGLDEAQLESRFPGEILITSHMQMTPPLWKKVKKN